MFHIPGYDPIHPRCYRELYRKESAVQVEISLRDWDQAAKSDDSFRWVAGAKIDGQAVASQIDVLVWSDIVRDSTAQSSPRPTYSCCGRPGLYHHRHVASADVDAQRASDCSPIPRVVPVGPAVHCRAAGWLLGGAVARILGQGMDMIGLGDAAFAQWVLFVVRWFVLGVVATVIIRWFKSIDNKVLPIT